MADVPWTASVRNSQTLTIDASAVNGPDWTTAVSAAIRELNTLFAGNKVNVTLNTAKPAVVVVALSSGPYTFTVGGTVVKGVLRTDILHGVTRSVDIQLGNNTSREQAYIFLPQNPKVDPQVASSRLVGEPVMRLIVAHEFLHALGLDAHDPAFQGLLAESWTLNQGSRPAADTVTPFGGSAKLPPLTLSADTVSRLRKLWP